MKKTLIIFLILIISILSWANTLSFKSRGSTLLYKKINTYNVEITIQDQRLNYANIHIPAEISHEDTIFHVIGITDNAFSGNSHIRKVTFDPDCDMQYIGEGAFSGCIHLTEIELPSTISEIKPYTFAYCGFKFIEIHNFITSIGERAFSNCKNLKQIEMSENIERINNYAFANCTNLTSFTIPEKTKHLGYEILQANINIDTLYFNAINCEISGAYYDNRVDRTIGAFEYNNSIKEIIFGPKVERIPEYLLYNCHSIDSINFPKSIKQIDRFALHNTEWFNGYISDMVYVNDILYAYKGNKDTLLEYDFRENTTAIASHCFYNNSKIKYITLPDNIHRIYTSAFENCITLKVINLPYYLEYLGDYALKNCKTLTTIKFNKFLEHIGNYCFSNCSSLEKITLPPSLKFMGNATFYNCQNLQYTNIPNLINYIPAGTFSKCHNLEKVTLHNKITSIEEYAFAGCTHLDSINIPSICTKIGNRAFSNCTTLSQIDLNAKSIHINSLAFYKCENLSYINLLGVNRIDYKAFAYCKNLSNISFSKELTTISDFAFENCTSLYSIEIPQSVTKIGKRAFHGCTYLTSLSINNATTEIEAYAFALCSSLKNINLGDNIIHIGASAFRNCSSIESINLNVNIESIEPFCFANCKNLKSITIPQNVKIIDDNAFAGCENLTEINIPNSTTIIGEHAFAGCTNIASINIPQKVKRIKSNAFAKCFNLTNISFNAENCTTGKPIFDYTNNTTNLTIGNTVQIIDDQTFFGMNIKSVEIPASMNYIGNFAFANSTPLNNVSISAKHNLSIENSAFNNTTWINTQTDSIIYIDNVALKYIGKDKPTSIIFKEGTISIASNFMINNTNLETLHLPSSLENIGSYAFQNCSNLKITELPTSITNIGNYAFQNCIEIDSINLNNAHCTIGIAAFAGCKKLTKANLGNNITSIGNMAFAYCSSLKAINSPNDILLPENIETINNATFFNCKELKGKIIIPKNVTVIDDQAFEGCSSIHSIELSHKLRQISISAFNKNYNLTRFLDSSNKYFNTYNGILYSNDMSILYHCPQGYYATCISHNETKTINNYAFNGCTKIKYIILNNVEKIHDYSFNGCTKLKRLTLGKYINSLSYKAFNGCQNLEYISIKKENKYYKSIDGIIYSADMKTLIFCPRAKKGKIKIPKSVQHIADYAFNGCNQITKIITHKNIKTIGKDAFTDTNL